MGWYGGWAGASWFGSLMVIFSLWSVFWKGLALWRAARNGEKYWFIGLLVINTVGLLEILYLFVFTKGEKGVSLESLGVSAKPVTKAKPRRRRK